MLELASRCPSRPALAGPLLTAGNSRRREVEVALMAQGSRLKGVLEAQGVSEGRADEVSEMEGAMHATVIDVDSLGQNTGKYVRIRGETVVIRRCVVLGNRIAVVVMGATGPGWRLACLCRQKSPRESHGGQELQARGRA